MKKNVIQYSIWKEKYVKGFSRYKICQFILKLAKLLWNPRLWNMICEFFESSSSMGGMTFSKLAIFWVILLINRKKFNFLREGSLYLFGQLLRKWWVTYERDSYANVNIVADKPVPFYIQLHCKPTQTLRKKLNWLTHFFFEDICWKNNCISNLSINCFTSFVVTS